jgi:hypothetical protein
MSAVRVICLAAAVCLSTPVLKRVGYGTLLLVGVL